MLALTPVEVAQRIGMVATTSASALRVVCISIRLKRGISLQRRRC